MLLLTGTYTNQEIVVKLPSGHCLSEKQLAHLLAAFCSIRDQAIRITRGED